MADAPPPVEPVELRAGGLLLRPWRQDEAGAYWAALESPGGRLWHGSELATPDEVAAAVARRADWSTGDHASWAMGRQQRPAGLGLPLPPRPARGGGRDRLLGGPGAPRPRARR